jgi:hypothetical protein
VTSLRSGIQRRDEQVSDLTGMLYDADGVHLVQENTRLRELIRNLTRSLAESEKERTRLTRSLDGARANVKRERERNVTQLFGDNPSRKGDGFAVRNRLRGQSRACSRYRDLQK